MSDRDEFRTTVAQACRRRLWLVFLCIWVAFGCAPFRPDYPKMAVSVYQKDSEVAFKFGGRDTLVARNQTGLLRAIRISVYTLETINGQPIEKMFWRVEAGDPKSGVTEVIYGQVPEHFRQISPEAGEAPSFEVGRRYYVSAWGVGGEVGVTSFVVRRDTVGSTVRIDEAVKGR